MEMVNSPCIFGGISLSVEWAVVPLQSAVHNAGVVSSSALPDRKAKSMSRLNLQITARIRKWGFLVPVLIVCCAVFWSLIGDKCLTLKS